LKVLFVRLLSNKNLKLKKGQFIVRLTMGDVMRTQGDVMMVQREKKSSMNSIVCCDAVEEALSVALAVHFLHEVVIPLLPEILMKCLFG
jgi:hypothetical protein